MYNAPTLSSISKGVGKRPVIFGGAISSRRTSERNLYSQGSGRVVAWARAPELYAVET
jgi:hypothetical protein